MWIGQTTNSITLISLFYHATSGRYLLVPAGAWTWLIWLLWRTFDVSLLAWCIRLGWIVFYKLNFISPKKKKKSHASNTVANSNSDFLLLTCMQGVRELFTSKVGPGWAELKLVQTNPFMSKSYLNLVGTWPTQYIWRLLEIDINLRDWNCLWFARVLG